MLDIKAMIESTGLKTAEDMYKKPPPLPYTLYTIDEDVRNNNLIIERSVVIELYSEKVDRKNEEKIINQLNDREIEYKKDRVYINSEQFFMTTFSFNLIEKNRIGGI